MAGRKVNLAILGATGAVGREMLKIIHQQNLPYNKLKLLASKRSAGSIIRYKDKSFEVEEVTEASFAGIDICLASAGSDISKKWVAETQKQGVILIDNSSAFRLEESVPLVVPEVNPQTISEGSLVIGNPNCSTIQLVQVLHPLHQAFGLSKVIVSTYQAVSGAGKKGIDELQTQLHNQLCDKEIESHYFPCQIAGNIIPHIDIFMPNGYTKEEMKITLETRKILNEPTLAVTATCARVPVVYGHAEAVQLEFCQPVTPQQIKEILTKGRNIKIIDDPSQNLYPTPLDTETDDNTLVGRIRQDLLGKHWISLWIVANNLRKGAALNAVQIAEYIIGKRFK